VTTFRHYLRVLAADRACIVLVLRGRPEAPGSRKPPLSKARVYESPDSERCVGCRQAGAALEDKGGDYGHHMSRAACNIGSALRWRSARRRPRGYGRLQVLGLPPVSFGSAFSDSQEPRVTDNVYPLICRGPLNSLNAECQV